MTQAIKHQFKRSKTFTRAIEIAFMILVSTSYTNVFYLTTRFQQEQPSKDTEAIQPAEMVMPACEMKPAAKIPHFSSSYNDVFNPNSTERSLNSNEPPPLDMWLLDPASYVPENLNVIPHQVFKIFFQKASGYPSLSSMKPELKEAHATWHKMNPSHKVHYFDLEGARKYIHHHFHPVFLRAFDCLTAFASKADLFRMILLYREGGFYSDWKEQCLEENVLDDISNVTDFFAGWDKGDSKDGGQHKCVQTAFVGARPQHPVIARLLKMILVNVQNSHYWKGTLDPTGPCVFGRAVQDMEREYKSAKLVAGVFMSAGEELGNYFKWDNKFIVKHKCKGCGEGQDWGPNGNNYWRHYGKKTIYCEDAASLFHATA